MIPMMTTRAHGSTRVSLATATAMVVATVLMGCPAGDDGDTGNVSASIGSAESSGSASASASATATEGMTGQMTAASMTAGSEESGSSSGGPVEPQPNGSTCEENTECESGFCFYISLIGGICGECNADADCPAGGCSLPNPLAEPPTGAHCNMGAAGDGCMSDEVCTDGLVCASIINVPNILDASTCSECLTDADCDMGMLCSPMYDVLNISGEKVCVAPGSVPNGPGCDFMGSGAMACESGLCATVDIMTLLQLGVCGDCGVDADCTAPDVCLPADIDTATGEVTPPTCGTPA